MVRSKILKQIARNPSGSVFYCSDRKNFFLNYNNKYQCYTAGQFIGFWEQINEVDLESMINNASPHADIEVIHPKGTEYIYVLSILEILNLKNLINKSVDIVAPVDITIQ